MDKGKKTREETEAVLERIKPTLQLEGAVQKVDIVVEAVIEVMAGRYGREKRQRDL